MKKIKTLCIIVLMICQNNVTSQSYFSTQDEVINYFEGSWTLNAISWMGNIETLPSGSFLDSSTHNVEFIVTGIDSLPLRCKSYVNGMFHEERLIEIEFETDDGFPGPWRLKNLPEHFSNYVAILEDADYFYELSEDSLTLFEMAFDGLEYGLIRNSVSNIVGSEKNKEIKIYPNPVVGNKINYEVKGGIIIKSVRILDYTGKAYKCKFQGGEKGYIDLGKIDTGFYIIELLDSNKKMYREKIVKMR